VELERGMPDGGEIRLENEGAELPDQLPGDLVLRLRTEEHRRFKRRGDDLSYQLSISLLESLVGFRKEIEHLDGHKVAIERSEVTPPGTVLQVRNEGMPMHNTPSLHGTLYVEVQIRFPKDLTEDQKEGIRKILKK